MAQLDVCQIITMEFKDVISKRYSMRQYHPIAVPENLVREVVELAKLAPSAGNLQSYKVYVTRERITRIEAPLYFVICADPERSASRYGDRGRNFYALQDATIFASYLQLAIVNLGLACAWVGAFKESNVKSTLNIPKSLKIVTLIPAGYPIGEKSGRRRRSFEEIVSWQK